MEFLDPKKQKQSHIYLMICYGLMTIAVVLATVILLSLAYGFGVGRNGHIVQNGLVYTGSTPSGASIFVDGAKRSSKTNSKLTLQSGSYTLRYDKEGYNSWQHRIAVNGGDIERYDYALLSPQKLKTKVLKNFASSVNFATQSRDHDWLIVQDPALKNEFFRYNIDKPKDPAVLLDLPVSVLTNESATTGWEAVAWASDNQHVLLKRSFTQKTGAKVTDEYILLDIKAPDESVNLSEAFGSGNSQIDLFDGKHDEYYIFSKANHTLSTASIDKPEPVTVLRDVAAYKAYKDKMLLYVDSVASKSSSGSNIVAKVHLKDDNNLYNLGDLTAHGKYLLNMAQHDNDWYIAFGEKSENKVSVYKNPEDSLRQLPGQPLVPVQVLKITGPTYVAFSNNTRFIMGSNGSDLYTYDIKNKKGYKFTVDKPLDAPQVSAKWIDGYHLAYISGGKLVIFDYDNTNLQILQPADPALPPFFTSDFKYVYSFDKPDVAKGIKPFSSLRSTALRTPDDL